MTFCPAAPSPTLIVCVCWLMDTHTGFDPPGESSLVADETTAPPSAERRIALHVLLLPPMQISYIGFVVPCCGEMHKITSFWACALKVMVPLPGAGKVHDC